MDDLIQQLSVVATIFACLLVFILLTLNLYWKIRNYFPIKVNCWFCNQWTKVPYECRNSFNCPSCCQYNGFDNGGDYNKTIPEQYDYSFNKIPYAKQTTFQPSANKLCAQCSYNQELKINQLAHFVPLNENNYDIEIEHFKKHLEKVYKLCCACEKVLKTTILQQNMWLFGKKIFSLRNRNLTPSISHKNSKLTNIKIIVYCVVVAASIFLIGTAFESQIVDKINWRPNLPYKSLLANAHLIWTNSVRLLTESIISDLFIFHNNNITHNHEIMDHLMSWKPFKYCMDNILSLGGLFCQVVFMVLLRNFHLQLLAWVVSSAAVYTFKYLEGSELVAWEEVFKIMLALVIVLSIVFQSRKQKHVKKKKTLRKHKESHHDNSNDFSDDEISEYYKLSGDFNCKVDTVDNVLHTPLRKSGKIDDNYLKPTPDRCFSSNSTDTSPFRSVSEINNRSDVDINTSLNNLRLSAYSPTHQSAVNTDLTNNMENRSKPILWPSKLEKVTQNSWVAGGFWHNKNGFLSPCEQFSNLSRSSSQSSGFQSQGSERPNFFSSLPSSRNNSICGDFDRASIMSEPPSYHYKNFEHRTFKYCDPKQQLFLSYKRPVMQVPSPLHFPVLSSNEMLYLASNYPVNNMNLCTPVTLYKSDVKQSHFHKSSLFKPFLQRPDSNSLLNWAEKMDSAKLDSFRDLRSEMSDKLSLS